MRRMMHNILHSPRVSNPILYPECNWRAFQAWDGPDNHAHRQWTNSESTIIELIGRYGDDHSVGYTPLRFSWPADNCEGKIIPVAWSDEWILDIDDKENIDHAVTATEMIFAHLTKEWQIPSEQISMWFSGRRGFHLVITISQIPYLRPDPLFHEILEEMRVELRQKLHLDEGIIDTCFDKSIQIVRAPYTRHTGSGLYKVPLSPEELNRGSDAILELAVGA